MVAPFILLKERINEMIPIEKNDVDLVKLFNWTDSVDVLNDAKEKIITVYMRLIGDADLNRSRVHALRRSRVLRDKLHDTVSDEYLAYMMDITSMPKSKLVSGLCILYQKGFVEKALIEVAGMKSPKAPKSDATLGEQEKYQQEIDEFPKKRQERIVEIVNKAADKKRDELSRKPKQELVDIYNRMAVDYMCEQEMVKAFREMCTFFACYADPNYRLRLYSDFEEFINTPTQIKEQLLKKYQEMEIDAETLKKSQPATP
jgi:hypothetical protein